MYDDLFKLTGVIEKFIAYPSQIKRILHVEGNTRPDACVHEAMLSNDHLNDSVS